MRALRIMLGLLLLGLIASYGHADTKISAMPAASALVGTEKIQTLQAGANVVTTPAALNTYINSATGSLANKTLDCSLNTCTNLPTAQLVGQTGVANGGSGIGTLTGPIKGNGTSAFSAAVASDIASLFTGGSSTSSYYLAGDGTKQLIASGASGANPTAVSGLSAVNGVATTFLRSDGAPAIDQTIAPIWTGIHTFSAAEPRVKLNETDSGTDQKLWDIDINGAVACLRTRTDADGAGVNAICFTRNSTTGLTDISIGSGSNTYTFGSTGLATFSGSISGSRLIPTGSSVPTNGMYLPAGNTVGFASNSVERFHITSAGITMDSGGFVSGGTKFTASGCSNSTTVGGATAGSFVSGTTGACTVTITLPTAPNGWVCHADDLTTPANFIGQSASTTTSCTVTGTTVTGDAMNFMAIAF